VIIDQLEEIFHRIKETGKTMLVVEQNYHLATSLADHCFVLVQGANVWEGTPAALEANQDVKHQHLGV
jgi:branched-chain amino acid transport system ATP-binding protein